MIITLKYENMKTDQNKSFFSLLLESKVNLLRGLLLISIIGLFIIGIIEFTFYKLKSTDYNIEFNHNGAVLIQRNNDLKKAQYLLQASSRWTNTGIKIQNGQKIRLIVYGKISTSGVGLFNSLENVQRISEFHKWIDIEGKEIQKNHPVNKFLIEPKANIGNIIGFIETAQDIPPGVNNLRPKGLFVINEKIKEITNIKEQDGTLWFTINDIYFDSNDTLSSKKAFFGRSSNRSIEEQQNLENSWTYIEKNGYWDILFEDNVGEYLINIEILK